MKFFFAHDYIFLSISQCRMSLCSSADIALYQNATLYSALDSCITSNSTVTDIVETCFNESGFSTDCSTCWNTFTTDINACLIGVCMPALDTDDHEPCLACLDTTSNLIENTYNNTICGMEPTEDSGMSVESIKGAIALIREQFGTATKSTTIRKIASGVILLALFISIM